MGCHEELDTKNWKMKNNKQAATAETPKKGRTTGPGRLLITVYGIFAISATARALFQIATQFGDAPVAYSLSAFAAIVYIFATICLAKPGHKWARAALVAIVVELVGVLVVGFLSIFDSAAFPHATVWSNFGGGYGYIPLVLPIIGLWWLWHNRKSDDS